jgi:hypothetical protein
MAKTLFGDEVQIADPPAATTMFGDAADAPVVEQQPLDTEDAFDRAGEVWDTSVDLGIPLDSAEKNLELIDGKVNTDDVSPTKVVAKDGDMATFGEDVATMEQRKAAGESFFAAAPDKTTWQKVKRFFKGDRNPLPPNQSRQAKADQALHTFLDAPLRTFFKYANGRTFHAGDLMWAGLKRITPPDIWDEETKDMTLSEATDWAMGYNPSGFAKMIGDVAEFAGGIQTAKGIGIKTGILGGGPKDISVLQKAGEAAKLFGLAGTADQVAKAAATKIDPTDAEYGYEGATAVLRDMSIGAAFSFLGSGVKGVWSKLSPTEQSRALKLLKLKKNATPDEIKDAAEKLILKFHPDKAKGFRDEFEAVINARSKLLAGESADMVFRGQPIKVSQKLLTGKVVKPAVKKPARIIPEEVRIKQALKPSQSVTPAEKEVLGVEPLTKIRESLVKAKAVKPLIEAEKKAELGKRVGAAAGALESNLKKGTPVDEAVFKSTGLLKGELTDYEQRFDSIESQLSPAEKDAAFSKITDHPDLKYLDIVNTTTSFKKLLVGSALTDGDIKNIERVFGKTFVEVTDERLAESSIFDKAITLWKAGLLTGIKTSGLNIVSTMSHAVSETAKDLPAAGVDSIASLFTGERTLAFTTKGTKEGTIKGVKDGWEYLKTGHSERDIGKKLDFHKVNFGTSKVGKALQAYEETIFHLLGAEDQPFYYGAKARSIFSQAIAKGKTQKLKGKELDAFVENLIGNPTDDMLTAAVHDAEVAVFQNRTGFGDMAKKLQEAKFGPIPVGEIIIPFGRTPSAVATQIINYTPVGAVKEVAEQIHKGVFNQRQFSQAVGRAALGTGSLWLGGQLLKAGLMTLDRPRTERERKLWELEGRKPNSIKIGGKWRSIQTLGPVGNTLVIGGHFAHQLEEEGSPTIAIGKALGGSAKSFSEQTFVKGVNQAVSALVDPERSFENWFSSMAGSVVPTLVSDIARASDETERRTGSPVERIQSRIPGLREKLPPKIDVFGQDLPRYGGNVLEVMIDPTRPSKIRNDVVVDELRRLADNEITVTPTQLGDRDGFDILTPEENTELWRRSGELTYKMLLSLVNEPGYKKLNDFAKGKMIDNLTDKTRAVAKAEIVGVKIKQGFDIIELAESGLLSIKELEAIKFFGVTGER